jgi:hypothetical protein
MPSTQASEWIVVDVASGEQVDHMTWMEVTRLPAGVGGGVGASQAGIVALSLPANLTSFPGQDSEIHLEWINRDGSVGWSRALPKDTRAVADPGAAGAVDLDGDRIGDVIIVQPNGQLGAVWTAISGATGSTLWQRTIAGPWVHTEIIPRRGGSDLLFVSATPTGGGEDLRSLSFGVEPIVFERANGSSGRSMWQASIDPRVALPQGDRAAFLDVFVHAGAAPGKDPVAVSLMSRSGGTIVDSALREHPVAAPIRSPAPMNLAALLDVETGAPIAWATPAGLFLIDDAAAHEMPFSSSAPDEPRSNAAPAPWAAVLAAFLLVAAARRRASRGT